MSSQQQPSWNNAAAAAYYAYATQAAAAAAPPTAASAAPAANPADSTTAQFVGKIGQYWDVLPEAQRVYFLAAVQNYQPPPATESDRLGLAKLMAFQYYEQYQAQQHQAIKNPAADATTVMPMNQQQIQQQQQHQLQQQQLAYQAAQMQAWAQPVTSSFVAYRQQQQQQQHSPHNLNQSPMQPAPAAAGSKRSKSPARASKGSAENASSSAAPWRSSSASSSPNVNRSSTTSRSSVQGVPADSKVDRKKHMGDFVREMLTLLKASPPACADYVKEKLKPLGHAFLHDANPAPLPVVRAFVTGAIAEYKRQHLLTNPTLSNHNSHGDASSHASSVYGPTRPMALKPPTMSSSSSSKLDPASRTSSQPSSPNLLKSKAHGATSYAAAAATPESNDQSGSLTTKKRKNAAHFDPDASSYLFGSLTSSSASGYSITSAAGSRDAEELKKREREQRFRSAEQRLAAERAAAQAMARANLAHYQEVHRAARNAAANGQGGGDDDGGFGDDPENEHGDLDDVVVGTSQALEKPFLRLTSAPDPTEVRPLPVLEKALAHLMNRWRESRDYRFMCDQLKSVRQDLLVQRIQNELTVKVYELHARIALEMGDMSEFNQCQTQLKILYERGVAGCHAEFLAYRILYFLYTKSRRDMKLLLSTLTPSDRANHYVAQALAVRAAAQRGDYLTFLDLYRNADLLMGTYLLDPMMDRERVKGMWTMTKSHMTVRMDRIVRQLAWDDAAQARVFINRVVDQVCDARCVQPVPADRSEYKVQEGAEVVEGKKIRVMMEAWLVAFTKVDIKGQLD